MPRYIDYGSSYAVVNPDGTTTGVDIQYHWDGVVFVKILHPNLIDRDRTNFRAEQTARNADNPDVYTDIFGGHALTVEDIAWLRLAIDRGFISLDRALSVFGQFRAAGAREWSFEPNLPERVALEQELAFFGDFPGPDLRVADLLAKPNSYVNTTATDLPTSVWRTPDGLSLERAIAEAWINHSIPEIARAAEGLMSGATPVERAEYRVSFSLNTTTYQDWIQKLYLAFFSRPADPGGFNYYAQKLDQGGADILGIAMGFGASPEYVETYAGMTIPERIDAIYRNLFDRAAEPAGLQYWGERLASGIFNISNIAFSVLVGAQNDDATIVANRLVVAKEFTSALDTQREVNAYSGLQAANTARQLLGAVTGQPESVISGREQIFGAIKILGASSQLTANHNGDTIALTPQATTDVLIYGSRDCGRVDVITGLQATDRIDLSAFTLTNAVQQRALASPQTSDSVGFFSGSSVVIGRHGPDSHVYVDANKDGSFSGSSDAVIYLLGVELRPDQLTI